MSALVKERVWRRKRVCVAAEAELVELRTRTPARLQRAWTLAIAMPPIEGFMLIVLLAVLVN